MKAKKNYKGGGMLGKILNPGQMLPGKLGQFFSKLPGGADFGGDNRKNPSVTPNIPVPKLQEGGRINDDPKAKRKKKRKLRKLKRKLKKVSRGAAVGAATMAGSAAKGIAKSASKNLKKKLEKGGKLKKKHYDYTKTELTEEEKKAMEASRWELDNNPDLKDLKKSALKKKNIQEEEAAEQQYRESKLRKGQRRRYDKAMASGKERKITKKIDKRTRFLTSKEAEEHGIYDYSPIKGSPFFTGRRKEWAKQHADRDKSSRITKPRRRKKK